MLDDDALGRERPLDHVTRPVVVVGRKERHHHAHGQSGHRLDPGGSQLAIEKLVRDAGHHPGAVAGPVGCFGAAMVEAVDALHAESDDAMTGHGVPCANETDAARIPDVGGVIERIARSRSVDGEVAHRQVRELIMVSDRSQATRAVSSR
jgi:hypothetical protein